MCALPYIHPYPHIHLFLPWFINKWCCFGRVWFGSFGYNTIHHMQFHRRQLYTHVHTLHMRMIMDLNGVHDWCDTWLRIVVWIWLRRLCASCKSLLPSKFTKTQLAKFYSVSPTRLISQSSSRNSSSFPINHSYCISSSEACRIRYIRGTVPFCLFSISCVFLCNPFFLLRVGSAHTRSLWEVNVRFLSFFGCVWWCYGVETWENVRFLFLVCECIPNALSECSN